MNQRIQALLVRLAEDDALRQRFVQDGRAVMNEAGLEPTDRAEVVRHVDVNGYPHSASIVPTEETASVPGERVQTPSSNGNRY